MRIGNIDLGERPVFLAPMEDVTDIGFRMLCKRFGASMVYTEFVSAEALVRDVKTNKAGMLCPVCRQGLIIRGNTQYGCSRWREGCSYREPF